LNFRNFPHALKLSRKMNLCEGVFVVKEKMIRVNQIAKYPPKDWLEDAEDAYKSAVKLDDRKVDPDPDFFMARAYRGEPCGLDRVFGPLERLLYRCGGIRPESEMSWREYSLAFMIFNVLGIAAVYLLQRMQGFGNRLGGGGCGRGGRLHGADFAPRLVALEFLGNQPAVPRHDGIWKSDGSDLLKVLATQPLADLSRSRAFWIGKAQAWRQM
jgi:hypothetical protein